MIYTIATLEQPLGETKLFLDKCGNQYTVAVYNTITKKSNNRRFENIESAIAKFQKLSELVIKGYGSFEDKCKLLLND